MENDDEEAANAETNERRCREGENRKDLGGMVRDSGSSRRKKMGPQSHHRVLAPGRRGAVVGPDDRCTLRTRARNTRKISEMRWRVCCFGKPDTERAHGQAVRSVDR